MTNRNGWIDPNTYVSGDLNIDDSQEYNVELRFVGANWTDELKATVTQCADFLSKVIVGDLPDATYLGRPVDDVTIDCSIKTMDGPGRELGRGTMGALRSSALPISGKLVLDSADVERWRQLGLLGNVVLHEMLHAIGFGHLWAPLGLVANQWTSNPTFVGVYANAAHPSASNIFVEGSGPAGTKLIHWRESSYGNELMTGWIGSTNHLAYWTIASLRDLGYQVVAEEDYEPPAFLK